MQPGQKFDVTVVICAYTEERWDALVAAIRSLQCQVLPPDEIIVVIDHNARLFERIRAQVPEVRVIENSGPRGLSGARNQGIAEARSTWVAFLDDDAVAETDWLLRLSLLCGDQQILGVGGAVEPLWSGRQPSWFPEEFYWVVGCSYRGLPSQLSVVRNPLGGCTCFRREIFETVGGFRNGIGRIGSRPLGGEETEICIRAQQHWPEKVFLYEPRARIHHHVHPQRASWRYFWSRCYSEGLSKAAITRLVGATSLTAERSYTFKTLPCGVLKELVCGVLHVDGSRFLRVAALVSGLALTAVGYGVAWITQQEVVGAPVEIPSHEDILPLASSRSSANNR